MGRYIIITNIWGKLPQDRNRFKWDPKESRYYPDFFEKARYEFDTYEELRNFISLFEDYCHTFPLPENIKNNLAKDNYWERWNEGERLWGYLWGDRETLKYTWGGHKLKDYNNGTDYRRILDMLFRLPGEIPNGYKFDGDEEYNGWLQYRWGDGKNAIDYVEPEKPKKIKKEKSYIPQDITAPTFAELLNEQFDIIEEKERKKILENRW